ncbi:MAG: zinc-ribbon domain-containing protein [Proteobacteria bacterium]|nr:zinc-ribbon domain-containing protein [Pseudomonadota bacterium]MBU1610857.1 zinc-ribbon domain-containing protein [Pseudomonadota bacterium]
MIVSCPNCATKYNLPDEKVPASGIKVKCSKCSHLFKVTPPPITPEEEVEVLLDDSATQEPEDKGSDFDAAFEEAVAGGDMGAGEDDDDDDDDDGLGDMNFDEDDAGDEEADPMDGLEDEDEEEDFDVDDDAFEEDLHDDDDDDDAVDDDEEDDDEEVGGLFSSLDEDSLDGPKKKKKTRGGGGGFGKVLKTLFMLLLLALVVGVLTYHFRLWSLPESMQAKEVSLPFELPIRVPFIKSAASDETTGEMTGDASGEMAEGPDTAPMDEPNENFKSIQPVDFRQYTLENEVEGPIFVVEGQAANKSESPKEMIKIEVTLFNAASEVIGSKEMLCGNTLSLLQLQVENRDVIEENLNSSRGINLNNAYIKPGETTPFMVVFFDLQGEVEQYRITVLDAKDPER